MNDDKLLARIEEFGTKLADARARELEAIPDMIEALQPFAAFLDSFPDPDWFDDSFAFVANNEGRLTIGDLRRARAALAKAMGEESTP